MPLLLQFAEFDFEFLLKQRLGAIDAAPQDFVDP